MRPHPDQHKIDARVNAVSQGYTDETGMVVVAGRIGGDRPVATRYDHDADHPTHLDMKRFAAWRESKCIPRDYDQPGERLADLTIATIQLTGEAGEVAEVILHIDQETPEAIFDEKLRVKLIDEIGDVILCSSWLADAWGLNPLRLVAKRAEALAAIKIDKVHRNLAALTRLALLLNCQSGLLSNAAKKTVYQDDAQDAGEQFTRINVILDYCAMILSIVNADCYQAMARVVEKIDHRWPTGSSLTGRGIRTGKGA